MRLREVELTLGKPLVRIQCVLLAAENVGDRADVPHAIALDHVAADRQTLLVELLRREIRHRIDAGARVDHDVAFVLPRADVQRLAVDQDVIELQSEVPFVYDVVPLQLTLKLTRVIEAESQLRGQALVDI